MIDLARNVQHICVRSTIF